MRALRQKSVLVHIGRCAVGGASDVSAAICSAACSVHDTTEASSWRLDSVHGSLRAARPLVSLTGFQQPPGASLQPAAAASSERQLSTSISQQLELQQACHTVRGSHRYWPAAAAALGGGGWRGFASDSRDGDVHDQRHRAADAAAPQGSDRQSQTPPAAGRESSAASGEPSAASGSGWTRREVWNAPNAISVARLVSGPVIASWIVAGDLNAALVALVISGWSDWLDGYVARRFDQQSILGSYLDPLADKVLIGSVVAALGIQGTLPAYLAAVIIGRDVFLVGASLAARAKALGWNRVSAADFFRIASDSKQEPGAADSGQKIAAVHGAGSVKPLYVSKVNTILQLATVSGFLLHACVGWPTGGILDAAALATAGTTLLSGMAYVKAYRKGTFAA